MPLNKSILRQLNSLQVDANKLISGESNLDHIDRFFQFASETKAYIIEHCEEEIIKDFAMKIQDVQYDDISVKSGVVSAAVGLVFPAFTGIGILMEAKRKKAAIEHVHELKGNFGSLEFMVRNVLS